MTGAFDRGGNIPHPKEISDEHGASPHRHLPLHQIRVNPHQPRSSVERSNLNELVASIQQHGILQPLIVTPKDGGFELIAGERRFQAAKRLGLKVVPAIVREVNQQEQLELALVENLQRRDLNPLEEAEAFQRLVDEFNLTQEQIARRVGKSRSYVANTLRLRGLPDAAKKAIVDGTITEGHAKVLLSIPRERDQLAFLKTVIDRRLTVRAAETLAKERRTRSKITTVNAELASNVEALQQALGTKVVLHHDGDRGTLTIEFYSREELSALLERLRQLTP